MNIKEENICRLCLKVAENDFQLIDEITTHMFEVLMIKINLDISKDPIVCEGCTEVVIKCFNFKSACVNRERLANKTTLKSEDIFSNKKDIETVYDNYVCQFCMNRSSGSALINDVTFTEKLRALMPEMDFDVTKDPVICMACQQDLERYVTFAENCLGVDDKISKYCQNEGASASIQVKLSDVLYNNLELDYKRMNTVVKQEGEAFIEHPGVYNSELVKPDEVSLDIKEHGVNFLATENLVPSTNIVSDVKIFMCAMCTYETNTKAHLKRHTLIHKHISEVETYKCSLCDYLTKRKDNLKSHILVHKSASEVEMYKCPSCDYQVKRKKDLKSHMFTHKDVTEVDMFKCTICTYQTNQKGNLNKHILIHKDVMEVELYKCPTCSYKTKRKGYLQKHMIVHKNITDKEMYKCLMCSFQSKLKGNLKKHTLIHKDAIEVEMYRCSACSYESIRKAHLQRHMLVHKDITEVERYKCVTCSYQTKYKNTLKRHMVVHKS